jgi:hypothetical protein
MKLLEFQRNVELGACDAPVFGLASVSSGMKEGQSLFGVRMEGGNERDPP